MNEANNKVSSEIIEDDPKQLVQLFPLQDSPFTIVKHPEGWFVTMGKYRLSEPMPTRSMAEEIANDTTWHRIMQVIQIMIEENGHKKPKANTTI